MPAFRNTNEVRFPSKQSQWRLRSPSARWRRIMRTLPVNFSAQKGNRRQKIRAGFKPALTKFISDSASILHLRLLRNIQQYAVRIRKSMLADRTSFEIFHQTAALRPTADFFGRGFGMLR